MDSSKPDFKILDHTADLGITVRGYDLQNLFESAAKSMLQVMFGENYAEGSKTLKLSVQGEDLADLMVRWLGEILYIFEGENEMVTDVEIDSIVPSHLYATVKTIPFNPDMHEIFCEIKAVSYHQIQVAKKNHRWKARIIFDL